MRLYAEFLRQKQRIELEKIRNMEIYQEKIDRDRAYVSKVCIYATINTFVQISRAKLVLPGILGANYAYILARQFVRVVSLFVSLRYVKLAAAHV